MSLVVTVVFTGIVLIQQSGAGPLTAYLPSEYLARSSANTLPKAKVPFLIPPHAAYVKVKHSQSFGKRPIDLQFVDHGDLMDVYFLQKDEKLTVKTDSKDQIQQATSDDASRGLYKLAYVMNARTLSSHAALKARATLNGLLAGEVTMTTGTIYAADLSSSWEFAQIPKTTLDMPQSVRIQTNVTNNEVHLESSISGNDIIVGDHPDPSYPIEIEIGNGTLPSIEELCPHAPLATRPALCDEGEDEQFDFHYELYADLLDGYLVAGKPPIPHHTGPSKHVSGSNCPPLIIQ